MTGKSHEWGSDFAKIDAHVIQPEEYEENPELTEEWFAMANIYEGGELIRQGRGSREGGSDMARVDAHVIQPEEYEELPEWTDATFDAADLYQGGKLIRRGKGRPAVREPKRQLTVRYSPEVVDYFRATGPGWQTRMDAALKEWIAAHPREA